MSARPQPTTAAGQIARGDSSARESITYYNAAEEREADKAPLSGKLIRRIFSYTRPYSAKRNWLFVLTILRGLQLPALAWLIGRTINVPISHRNLPEIYGYAAGYFALALFTVVNFHFRQRFALEWARRWCTTCARPYLPNWWPCRWPFSTRPNSAGSSAG